MLSALLSVLGFIGAVRAIAWGVILEEATTGGNEWTALEFTVTVPPAPSSDVTSGPWFFWGGVQPGLNCDALGVIQPVLQWDEYSTCAVNDDPGFTASWQLVQWTVPSVNHNGNQSDVSCGIWAAQGDLIWNTVTFSSGTWTQTSKVVWGKALGASVTQTIEASDFFCPAANGGSTANFFLLESELYGDDISNWNFDVQFWNVSITAATTSGVADVCGAQVSFSDGNGNATLSGYSLSEDKKTCKWESVTLIPPPS